MNLHGSQSPFLAERKTGKPLVAAICLLKARQGSGWRGKTGAYAKRHLLAEGKAGNPLVGNLQRFYNFFI
jgi:hypothetical protein